MATANEIKVLSAVGVENEVLSYAPPNTWSLILVWLKDLICLLLFSLTLWLFPFLFWSAFLSFFLSILIQSIILPVCPFCISSSIWVSFFNPDYLSSFPGREKQNIKIQRMNELVAVNSPGDCAALFSLPWFLLRPLDLALACSGMFVSLLAPNRPTSFVAPSFECGDIPTFLALEFILCKSLILTH